jgi:S-adenosylmethionine:diacylglycerol 3-amino-3-carboxypropyl transferase
MHEVGLYGTRYDKRKIDNNKSMHEVGPYRKYIKKLRQEKPRRQKYLAHAVDSPCLIVEEPCKFFTSQKK